MNNGAAENVSTLPNVPCQIACPLLMGMALILLEVVNSLLWTSIAFTWPLWAPFGGRNRKNG